MREPESDYRRWCRGLTLVDIQEIFLDHGCDAVLVKHLAPNDNSKNQVYLGAELTDLTRIPSGIVEEAPRKSKKKRAPGAPIFRVRVPFSWATPQGLVDAPGAQLIYYPQYPEVRLSGFLQGTRGTPGDLFNPYKDGRLPGRVLLLGVNPVEQTVVALLLAPGAVAIADLQGIDMVCYGALEIWNLARTDPAVTSTRDLLLAELRRIHDKGWITSKRLTNQGPVSYTAPNGGGYTLEAELDVLPNGDAAPDFMGWEIKQRSVRSFDSPSTSALTLMTPEPDGGVYVDEGIQVFMRTWGRETSRERIDFTGLHRVGQVNNRTGLSLRIDGYEPGVDRVVEGGRIVLVDEEGAVAGSWSFAKLLQHWKRKHSAAAYVLSEKRVHSSSYPEYRYGNIVVICEGTSFKRFLSALDEGSVYYDPGIHIDRTTSGQWKAKKRNQFRINSRNIDRLYSEMTEVDLVS